MNILEKLLNSIQAMFSKHLWTSLLAIFFLITTALFSNYFFNQQVNQGPWEEVHQWLKETPALRPHYETLYADQLFTPKDYLKLAQIRAELLDAQTPINPQSID